MSDPEEPIPPCVPVRPDTVGREIVFGGVAADCAGREREERLIRADLWGDRDARLRSAWIGADSHAEEAVARVGRQGVGVVRDPLVLAELLVIAEYERL